MIKLNTISPRNTMAISAMLMLSAGTAFAQDATVPVTDAPVIAAPAAPTVVIPVPEPVASAPPAPVATTAPVMEPVAQEAAKPVARASTAARTAARTAAPASPPAPSVEAQAVMPPDAAPAAAPVTETQEAAPPPPVVTDEPGAPDWALPVGAAATLLVLGGVGLAMSRRRRPYEEDVDFVPPIATRPALRPQPERRVAPPMPPERPATVALATTSAVGSSGERAALIERIVASPPDTANPFRSRKARRRRARIMVQSMAARGDVPTSAPRPADPVIVRDYASA